MNKNIIMNLIDEIRKYSIAVKSGGQIGIPIEESNYMIIRSELIIFNNQTNNSAIDDIVLNHFNKCYKELIKVLTIIIN